MWQQRGNGEVMRRNKFRVRRYGDRKRPNLKFVVSGRENGKRTRRFFMTKAEADSYAQAKNIELRNKRIEGAEFPTWLRVMAEECNRQLAQRGRTIKDATAFFLQHLEASEKSSTAAELVDELIEAKETDGASKRHLEDLRSRLNAFAEKFDGKAVATITTAELDDWLRSLPVSAVTRNHYRRLIVLAFNFAVQRRYATQNPAENTAKARERRSDIGILTVAEAARLLESATADVLPYVAIGLFAGLRRAEIERLDWTEIDFESDLIKVEAEKSKTAQKRFVKMQPNLREWLLPVRQHKGSVTPEDFRKEFDAARVAAGITEWPDNALRHSFASYHLAHFQNAASTALELGHHDARITFRHYRELVKPREAERYWNIRPAKTAEKVVPMLVR
jgi:integrase